MTNIFIDCEFNGFGGDLISMALVSEDGNKFYEVLNLENDTDYSLWVSKNVVPILNKQPISKDLFQHKLFTFINQYDNIHIIADWPDDIRYFCQSLIKGPGVAMNTPYKMTMQVARELNTLDSKILHNALEDAKAIQRSWNRRIKEAEGYGVEL